MAWRAPAADPRRLLAALAVSAALHGAVLAWASGGLGGAVAPAPLFIDLAVSEGGDRSIGSLAPAASPAPRGKTPPSAGRPGREIAGTPAPDRPAPAGHRARDDAPQVSRSAEPRPQLDARAEIPPRPSQAAPAEAAPVPAAPVPPAPAPAMTAPDAGLAAPSTAPAVPADSPGSSHGAGGPGATKGAGSPRDAAGGTGSAPADPPGAGGDLLALGRGGAASGEATLSHGQYIEALRRRVQTELHYPLSARRRGLVGTSTVDVVIDPPGVPRSVELVESARHPELDAAALEAVRAAARHPMPPELARRPVRVRLPVVFELR